MERGQTKILLTTDSNLIDVHELKKAYEKTGPSYPGRGRGRGRGRDALTRFFHREDRLMGGGQPILPFSLNQSLATTLVTDGSSGELGG